MKYCNCVALFTRAFFRWDSNLTEPELVSVMYEWMNQIKNHAVTYNESEQVIRYQEKDAANLKEYLNLVRWDATEIGCASVNKTENGQHKLRAYCLIDKPALKENDVVYSVGDGGCPKDLCPAGFTCSFFGMCKKIQ
ncbi:hypothetical protein OESDEN_07292 [Oesophagostomum dentatum]|uniref:SCP domain-containing protein n=1 Tax=Oesophagostomum dentatum TaxID=61180 RepID=A0A0B1TBT7_OESDE|nr:hypothetical protein OESDEN_07292 [Oesophagostomum dentatum]